MKTYWNISAHTIGHFCIFNKETSLSQLSSPYDQPEVLPVDGELDAEGDGGVDGVEDDGAGDLGEDVDHGLPDVACGGQQGRVEDGEAEGEGGVTPHPAPHTVQGGHVTRLRVQTRAGRHVQTRGDQSNQYDHNVSLFSPNKYICQTQSLWFPECDCDLTLSLSLVCSLRRSSDPSITPGSGSVTRGSGGSETLGARGRNPRQKLAAARARAWPLRHKGRPRDKTAVNTQNHQTNPG